MLGGERGGAGRRTSRWCWEENEEEIKEEEEVLGGDRGADGGGRGLRGAEEERLYPGLGAGGELHCNIHY